MHAYNIVNIYTHTHGLKLSKVTTNHAHCNGEKQLPYSYLIILRVQFLLLWKYFGSYYCITVCCSFAVASIVDMTAVTFI